ncbi:MAG: hypothetical protein J1E03_06240 [Acetatifactor sp.]|nr:hypothetical protein [Acetatifactor sp.]
MKEATRQTKTSKGRILVLCDTEEEYAQLMTDFLKKQKNLPWELRTYTDVQELLRTELEQESLLVVAESAFTEDFLKLSPARLVVLNESGLMRWENISYVDKYQKAENVLRFLLEIYMEIADNPLPRLQKGCKTVFIGNYSPVHRSMQTSMALTLGQLLAKAHSTLYLNFEHYAGLAELVPDMQTYDMADLLYFLSADREKFRLRLQTMLKHIGPLDYIPPMKSGQNLLTITAVEWLGFFQKIEELEQYEYVILDLTESMQGLFQILRLCKKVFTATREDRIAQSKLLQYEQLLALCEYDDVLEKTKRLNLSHIRRLPEELEQMTKGELAELARDLLQEILE